MLRPVHRSYNDRDDRFHVSKTKPADPANWVGHGGVSYLVHAHKPFACLKGNDFSTINRWTISGRQY